ncbi:pentatricopeptide repeat-containing protein At2g22410, mitochondrial-like [Nymphaea colorata]|uniref:Pentacotripeptide-repeat region of PRORP domain-containing protein n=1 Tax=Nymphaea colorata TaxID=210225 RepID=A0A5K1GEY4_9MAGN|nr:pentatricopeptide repeat-containing protein At2g22410, mitochondrial-like [Nymphaea colorata]
MPVTFLSLPKLLALLESSPRFRDALRIHAQLIAGGLHENPIALRKVVSFFALASSGDIDHALLVFSQIEKPGIFYWNTLIRAYSKTPAHRNALFLYKQMLHSFTSPNNYTFPFLVNSCARCGTPESGMQVHSHIIKNGFDTDLFVVNAMMHMYSVFGDMDSARELFDRRPTRDVVSFNTMITGYSRGNDPVDALCVFREMIILGVKPDEYTMVGLLSACAKSGDARKGKQIHLFICKSWEIDMNLILESALIDMYAKLGLMDTASKLFGRMRKKSPMSWSSMVSGYAKIGEIENARLLFANMPEADPVTWTAMISGYSQAGYFAEALQLFEKMEMEGLKLDEVALVCALFACAGLGALDVGKRLHGYIKNRSIEQNSVLMTALVDMYCKCGCIDTALEVFYGVTDDKKSVCLFNAMISGLAQHGQGKKTLDLLADMEDSGLRPDAITFVSVLSACSHSGLIAEGVQQFYSMIKFHAIIPQIEHYTCVVDLLGRAGFLKEANAFLEKVPIEANSVAWRALLGACEVHGNVEIGELVGRRLLQLDPLHGGRYVLLSNIFSKSSRWDDARKMRELMSGNGIQKPPGWSLIELNGIRHQFLVNDNSQACTGDVHFMLEILGKDLKSAGNVPDNDQILDNLY